MPVWQASTQKWVGLIDTLDLATTLSSIIAAKLDALDSVAPNLSWDELELVQTQCIGELCGMQFLRET